MKAKWALAGLCVGVFVCGGRSALGQAADYGDAPDKVLAYPDSGILGGFPTCRAPTTATNWVQHNQSGAHFGGSRDVEVDGNAGACASFSPYDNDECFADGDAGLMFPPAYTIAGAAGSERVVLCTPPGGWLGAPCQSAVWGANVDIVVVNNMNAGAFVNVLADWDRNGVWAGNAVCPPAGAPAPEHVLVNFPVPPGFNGPLSALQPPAFAMGPNAGHVWCRFTITAQPVPLPWTGAGEFEYGETEDYLLQVAAEEASLDFGDAIDPTYPTLLANNGARHAIGVGGPWLGDATDAPDPETDGQPEAAALGDDNDVAKSVPNDDEDGVVFSALKVGAQGTATFEVNGVGQGSAYVDAWIDWNMNGTWEDPAERIVGGSYPAGKQTVPLNAPAQAGKTFARFRINSMQGGFGPTGLADDGEVEDHAVEIQTGEAVDFGDAPRPYPTLFAVNGARHAIVLGAPWFGDATDGPDPDVDGQPDAVATGDDLDILEPVPNDDEDGVVFSALTVGQPGSATVQVGGASGGWVDAWIDWNHSGTWDEPAERVFGGFLPAGTHLLPILPPVPYAGRTFARFRIHTLQGNLAPTGPAADGEVEDHAVDVGAALDFGDAPDPTYPTLVASSGACHVVVSGVFLGNLVDVETNGQPDATATGDDVNPPAGMDDEDGIVFLGPLYAGGTAKFQAVCSVSGFLSVWIDLNADGDWMDGGETIFSVQAVGAGPNTLSFPVSGSAAITNTCMRFRFTTQQTPLLPTGLAPDGEVEDYLVAIEREEVSLDFGDAWDAPTAMGYPTLLAHNGARHAIVPGVYLGSRIDAESNGQPTLNADGDDLNPPLALDDEDGVFLPPTLVAGSTVRVSLIASVAGYLNAWIDFNGNGAWSDPGEQVFANQPLAAGFNSLTFVVPPYPATRGGGPHSRWRFTTYAPATPSFVGLESNGEVEDYEVRLEVFDFGDAPDPAYPTRLASDGARHRMPSAYWLGAAAPDDEPDGQPTAAADGDDVGKADDEDVLPGAGVLVQGATRNIQATASTNGFLNVWVDFDQNGSWAEAGEQVVVDAALAPGANTVGLAAPAAAKLGATFGRVRFCSYRGLGYIGLATDGEVEDFPVVVYQQGPATNMVITNLVHSATNQMDVWWLWESNVTYETQYATNLLDTSSPPWRAFGPAVSTPPFMQKDTNAAVTAKFYRVVAPFAPPPP